MFKKTTALLLFFSFILLQAQETDHIFGLTKTVQPNKNDSKQIFLNKLLRNLKPGDTLKLKPGFYTGPATLTVPNVVIDGGGKATISAMGNETALYIKANNVTIQNIHFTNTGDSHDRLDAAIKIVEANHVIVQNNLIDESLFGVDLYKSNYCIVQHNDISSIKAKPLALKGDAIRLWYSTHNQIKHNYWHNVRDMVVWYSSDNLFEHNKGIGNRYSIHFMYSHNNRIHNNEFYNNSVGVFLMYSEQTIMTSNLIQGSVGATGMCLGLKETSSNQILNNRFLYSAYGIHFDVSPFVREKINTIDGNEIAFCNVGMLFHSDLEGNLLKSNILHNNLTQVYTRGNTANNNTFEGNYWSDYQGYDIDGDNTGDVPYRLYSYSEHLWDFNKNVKFFWGAPILEVLDFLERLAPFSEPKFVLQDPVPWYKWKKKRTQLAD
jgi:nitrous oxidase accessory protein